MEIAQSYFSTIMKGRFSLYEQRIMLKIVESTREITKQRGSYAESLKKSFALDGINLNYAIPVREILGNTNNYLPLKKAVEKLKHWDIEYYDQAKKKWYSTSMIYNIILEERVGVLRFSCSQWLIEYITDFRNGGYRSYELEIAIKLRNPFAARLYTIVNSMTKPLQYPFDGLREILGVKDQYKRIFDFERRVLQPARKEMQAVGATYFDYEIVREFPNRKRSKVKAIIIRPHKQKKMEQNISVSVAEIKQELPEMFVNYLYNNLGFSYMEIAKNKETLRRFSSLPDWQEKAVDIIDRCRRRGKGKFYIIAAFKAEVQQNGGQQR